MSDGTSQPLSVSVVIPVFNGAGYVRDAIESVLEQSMLPSEVIVVNDGSTDDSAGAILAAVREFAADVPIRTISHENRGQSASRNAAAAIATGDLLAFLDQDDLWRTDHLKRLVGAFGSRSDVGWAFSDFDEMDDEGRIVTRSFLRSHRVSVARSTIVELLISDLMVLPSASAIRATAFHQVGGFDAELRGYEDDDLFIRMFRADWRATFVSESLTVFRVHAASSSRRRSFRESRVKFYAKLQAELPDDVRLSRYYMTDVLRPRLLSHTFADYSVAISQMDFVEAKSIADSLRQLFPVRKPTLRRRLGLALLSRPRLSRILLRVHRSLPVVLQPRLNPALRLRG